MRFDKTLKRKIDTILADQGFRDIVEEELGPVKSVKVEWENERVIFHGMLASKELSFWDMKPLFDKLSTSTTGAE